MLKWREGRVSMVAFDFSADKSAEFHPNNDGYLCNYEANENQKTILNFSDLSDASNECR